MKGSTWKGFQNLIVFLSSKINATGTDSGGPPCKGDILKAIMAVLESNEKSCTVIGGFGECRPIYGFMGLYFHGGFEFFFEFFSGFFHFLFFLV